MSDVLKEISRDFTFGIAHRTSHKGEIHPHKYKLYVNVQPNFDGPDCEGVIEVFYPWVQIFNKTLVMSSTDPIVEGVYGPVEAILDGMNPRWVMLDVNPSIDMLCKHFWDVGIRAFGSRLYKVSLVEDGSNVYSFVRGKNQPEQGAPLICIKGGQAIDPILKGVVQWPTI